jgi:exonuclease SbcC
MIEKVILRDFKSHQYTEIPFPKGLVSICGENYAGKSSIVQAIGWTLFDSSPGKQDSFVRHGATKARISVDLRSPLDQKLYRVVRQIGSSTDWHIVDVEEGSKLADKSNTVRDWLRYHLQVRSSVTLRTLYEEAVGVPQGQLVSSFMMTEGQRRKHFDQVLGLSDFEEAYKRLASRTGKLSAGEKIKRERQSAKESVIQYKGETAGYQELQMAVKESTELLARLSAERDKLAQEASSIQKQLTAFCEQQSAIADAQVAREQCHQRLMSIERDSVAVKKQRERAQTAVSIVKEHRENADKYQQARTVLDESEEKRVACRAALDELADIQRQVDIQSDAIARLEEQRKEAREARQQASELLSLVEEQTRLEHELSQAEQDQKKRETVSQALTLINQKIADQTATLDDEQARIAALNERLALASQRATLQREKDECFQELTRLEVRLEWDAEAEQKPTFCPILKESCHNLASAGRTMNEVLGKQRTKWEKEIESLQLQHEVLSRELLEAEAAERDCAQLTLLQERVEELRETIEDQLEKCRVYEEDLARLQRADTRRKEAEQKLLALGEPLPSKRHARLLAAAEREDVVLAQLAKESKALQECQGQISALERQLKPYRELEQAAITARATMQACEEAFRLTLAHQQQAESHASWQHKWSELIVSLDETKQTLEARESELETLLAAYDREAHKELDERAKEVETQVASSSGRLEQIKVELAKREAQLAEMETKRERLLEAQQLYDTWDSRGEMLDTFRRTLRAAGPEMAMRTRRQLETQAQQLFAELVDDPGVHLQLSDSYGLQLTYDSFTREHEALAGSEGIMAALAVRLGLLTLASNLQFAFFDEPTIHLDKEHRMKLAEQLCHLKSIEQLIVISHDDSFESNVDHMIFVTKADGVSYVEVD